MDFRTWTPFDRQVIRDIKIHMTDAEKNIALLYGLASGIMVAIFFAGPLSLCLSFFRMSLIGPIGVSLLVWLIIGVFVMRNWNLRCKKLLCDTAWAKSQGITPDKI